MAGTPACVKASFWILALADFVKRPKVADHRITQMLKKAALSEAELAWRFYRRAPLAHCFFAGRTFAWL